MTEITLHEAETQFSLLVERVLAGEEIVVADDGKPLVQITLPEEKKPRIPGFAAGEFTVPDSFFEPMSEEDLDLWYK